MEIKRFYCKDDDPKNTVSALNALIRFALLPLSVYLLKFTSITEVLVGKGSISGSFVCWRDSRKSCTSDTIKNRITTAQQENGDVWV